MADNSAQQRQCSNCGAQVKIGELFCVSCGTRLGAQQEHIRQTKAPSTPDFGESYLGMLVKALKREFMGANVDARSSGTRMDDIEIGLAPEDVLGQAIHNMMVYQGQDNFTVAHGGENSVTFRNYSLPNVTITILLLLPAALYFFWTIFIGGSFSGLTFFVLLFPLLVHLVGSGKHVYSGIAVVPTRGGCRVRISGESQSGCERLRTWVVAAPRPNTAEEPREPRQGSSSGGDG